MPKSPIENNKYNKKLIIEEFNILFFIDSIKILNFNILNLWGFIFFHWWNKFISKIKKILIPVYNKRK